MSDDMDTADVLDAAADYLLTFGVAVRVRGLDGGPRCASGAILSVLGCADTRPDDSPEFSRPWRAALKAVGTHVGLERVHAIGSWNDEHTAAEVIDALMEAAARLRTGEIKP